MTKKKETASTKQDKKHDKKVTLVKMPSYSTMLFGAIAAYWLSTIMKPTIFGQKKLAYRKSVLCALAITRARVMHRTIFG